MISRRNLLLSAASLPLSRSLAFAQSDDGPRDALLPLWDAWKTIHMSSTGRVIDRLQDNVSHSEGQGYAMLVAQALGDREGFDLLLDWTMTNLAVRPNDALLAWRWHPADGGSVTDMNNASDGDLFAAWALMRAAENFDEPRYAELGRTIGSALVNHCIRPAPASTDGLILIPGMEGFEVEGGYILNPAYYMLKAMTDLGETLGEPALNQCAADGIALLSRLARRSPVPDWFMLTAGGAQNAPGKSGDFGYEAMRVPLYLIWSGMPGHPAVSRARDLYDASLATEEGETPTVVNRDTLEVLQASTDPGYRALAALTACAEDRASARLMPAFSVGQAYYPGILHLLSLLAQRESAMGCILK